MKKFILSLFILIPCFVYGKQYEYCTIEASSFNAHNMKSIKVYFSSDSVYVDPNWKSIEDAANYLGNQGYELVSTDVVKGDFVWHYLYFKREKESAKPEE